jgi:protein-disulfide isomerase
MLLEMKPTKMLLIGSAVALGAIVVAVLWTQTGVEPQGVDTPETNSAALERMHSPSLGPRGAKVVITEFLDPACETCRAFYPFVKDLMAEHPNDIRLVVRFLPFHKGSDGVVALLEAARRQNKLWPTLEITLATQPRWAIRHVADVNKLWPLLGDVDLDLERLRADMNSSSVLDVMNQDISDARTLKVDKTPGFFVNGKPLEKFGYQELKMLVESELQSSPE